ncbi:MAG: hypothetical protein GY746_09820 [Gammaproteobacteria bacterium]|nr:hypothetical protein [Gammaproteobacteria bacterium]MCP4277033.1 hypothetical protein [Gammaproteobacteria bacterium]MCP4832744.1 hypothetical protein [Gammaproteobacteria bacterium]MCP4929937.1 hypothetical protein [Gammaproteobacteria bacterium]
MQQKTAGLLNIHMVTKRTKIPSQLQQVLGGASMMDSLTVYNPIESNDFITPQAALAYPTP